MAVSKLINEWSSLPGGVGERKEMRQKILYKFTLQDLIEKYNIFLKELELN